MKRLRRHLVSRAISFAAFAVLIITALPLVRQIKRPPTAAELELIAALPADISVNAIRLGLLAIVIINTLLVRQLLRAWFGGRRGATSTFIVVCIPIWIIAQFSLPLVALQMLALLIALWSFDAAGRSDKAAVWYGICGLAVTGAWLLNPIVTMIVAALGTSLLALSKPRYIGHIVRQASFVLIIAIVGVSAAVAASWKLNLGLQEYLVKQLSQGFRLHLDVQAMLDLPSSYYIGLPKSGLVPLTITVLALLGGSQLFLKRKRPRNAFILMFVPLIALITTQTYGATAAVLLLLGFIGVSCWSMSGIEYLYASWTQLFPHNMLARTVRNIVIGGLLASLALYSNWYITRAWLGDPQRIVETSKPWSGQL